MIDPKAKPQEERDEDAEIFERWYFSNIDPENSPFTPADAECQAEE